MVGPFIACPDAFVKIAWLMVKRLAEPFSTSGLWRQRRLGRSAAPRANWSSFSLCVPRSRRK